MGSVTFPTTTFSAALSGITIPASAFTPWALAGSTPTADLTSPTSITARTFEGYGPAIDRAIETERFANTVFAGASAKAYLADHKRSRRADYDPDKASVTDKTAPAILVDLANARNPRVLHELLNRVVLHPDLKDLLFSKVDDNILKSKEAALAMARVACNLRGVPQGFSAALKLMDELARMNKYAFDLNCAIGEITSEQAHAGYELFYGMFEYTRRAFQLAPSSEFISRLLKLTGNDDLYKFLTGSPNAVTEKLDIPDGSHVLEEGRTIYGMDIPEGSTIHILNGRLYHIEVGGEWISVRGMLFKENVDIDSEKNMVWGELAHDHLFFNLYLLPYGVHVGIFLDHDDSAIVQSERYVEVELVGTGNRIPLKPNKPVRLLDDGTTTDDIG